MWQLENRTPFAAERTWTRGRDGAEIWLVAVKCTYDIRPDGSTEVSADQPPVTLAPEYMNPDAPAQSSLKYDMDLVRTKTTTDILVHGHAYAPSGRPVTELEVGFRVGPVMKRLRVVGDRFWRQGSISAPQPFTRMAMVYERTYGGVDPLTRDTPSPQWDVRNPIGTGFAVSASAVDGMRLPNIGYPDQPITRWKDRPAPAGFGPICEHWQPRARFAGTYDEQWERERLPLVPDDFDDRYYQCAPIDQQSPQLLRGGEPVTLLNLTPGCELRFFLPRAFLGFETFFSTGERRRHERARLHTVIVDAEGRRVSLGWHTALPCHPMVYKLDRTRITNKEIVGRTSHVTDPAAEVA